MCSETGEPSCEQAGKPGLHYFVSEYTFTVKRGKVTDASEREIARAWESCGWGDTPDALHVALALFEYGSHNDPRQPGWYGDEYGSDFPTLRAAMDSYGIPARALWRKSEYDTPYTHEWE